MLHFIVGIFAVATSPQVIVDDASGCVKTPELERNLSALLPERRSNLDASINVKVKPLDDQREVVFEIRNRKGERVYQETYRIPVSDCPTVPLLLATVSRRQLDALPALSSEEPPAPPPSPEPEVKLEGAAPLQAGLQRPSEAPLRWHTRPFAAVGGGAGLSPLTGNLNLSLGASLGLESWPDVVLGVKGSVLSPITVGAGVAQAANFTPFGAASYEFDLGGIAYLVPRLGLSFGGLGATGVRYDQNEFAVLPWVSIEAVVSLYSRWGLFLEAGAEVPLVALALEDRSGAQTKLPVAWAFLRIGLSWRLDFGKREQIH